MYMMYALCQIFFVYHKDILQVLEKCEIKIVVEDHQESINHLVNNIDKRIFESLLRSSKTDRG